MRVGLAYDLRSEYIAAGLGLEETAEFDRDDTVEAIENALIELGHETDRIGGAIALVRRLAVGDRWDLVFNIAEGLHGTARESQVPAILDAVDMAYTFSDTLVTALCLQKPYTKLIVREAGVPTPRHAVVRRIEECRDVSLRWPLFAKPVGEGTSKGIEARSRVETPADLADLCSDLLQRFRQPVLVEEFLPGREFTVGITGAGEEARVLGTLEVVLKAEAEPYAYSYTNKERCEELVEYRFPGGGDGEVRAAERSALAAWRALGCRDAGRVDLRSDAGGTPCFLEVNPLPGLHPWHSDLPMIATAAGLSYRDLIARIVECASGRVKPRPRAAVD